MSFLKGNQSGAAVVTYNTLSTSLACGALPAVFPAGAAPSVNGGAAVLVRFA